MRNIIGTALAFGIVLIAASISAEVPKQLEPLTFLLGEWEASGNGNPGEGVGSATLAQSLQDRVIIRTSYAEYPASASAPASRHDDLMVIYAGGDAGIRADYYDNEGHIIHYAVTVAAPGEASFVSDIVNGAPRFRLSYKLGPDGLLKGEFAIAPPGKPEAFARYLAWESRKVSAGHSQDIPWSSFEWSGGSIGDKAFDRAALMVPVRLEHKPDVYWMQLDTGCNATMVYRIPFDQLKYPAQRIEGRDDFIAMSGTIGNCPFDSFPVFVREDFGDSLGAMKERVLIGTVGQDMLAGKVLVLDYPNRRFCLADSLNGVLEDLVSRASFVDLQRRNDKLFVPVRIGDMYSENFFLDTGTSMLPITTTKEMWQRLTGRQGTEKGNIRIKAPSWGKEVSLVGAPVKGTLTIGTLQVSNPIAYFESTGIVETDGILGNALFYDEYTIIIDLQENRFGILRNQ